MLPKAEYESIRVIPHMSFLLRFRFPVPPTPVLLYLTSSSPAFHSARLVLPVVGTLNKRLPDLGACRVAESNDVSAISACDDGCCGRTGSNRFQRPVVFQHAVSPSTVLVSNVHAELGRSSSQNCIVSPLSDAGRGSRTQPVIISHE